MAHQAPLFYCISLLVKSEQVIQNNKAYINVYAAAAKSLHCIRLCATPEMAAHQAPPSLEFFRQ